ncbi:MAG: TlpA family protein disulfide reductase [Planctomycetota bacterium]|nr:MAG: TlpA family protein disulfide reductase [Planctomycetota bacterium]
MPHLVQVHEELAEKGLQIVAVSNESRQVVESWVERLQLPFPVAAECSSFQDYEVDGIPVGFLIDRQGEVVWKGHPKSEAWTEQAKTLLAES